MTATTTDRIHKQLLLRAPITRVWQAIADAQRFGEWFGVRLDGTFEPGAHLSGRILDPNWAHVPFEITIERVEPERLLSFRWHPNPVQAEHDYSDEPTTLVVFELVGQADGTLLTVDESGFDGVLLSRRAEAYRGNEDGWSQQMDAIARYVGDASW
jgi:uncharacterized protein YndB with AHSA1/START domain